MNLEDRYSWIANPVKLKHLRRTFDEAERCRNDARRRERKQTQARLDDLKAQFSDDSDFLRHLITHEDSLKKGKTDAELLSEEGLQIDDELKSVVATYLQLKDAVARVHQLEAYLERADTVDVSKHTASVKELAAHEENRAKIEIEISQASSLSRALEGVLQEAVEVYLFGDTLQNEMQKFQGLKTQIVNRRSRATTDRMRARACYPTPSTDSYQATRHAISHNTFAEDDASTYPTATVNSDHVAGKIQLLPPTGDVSAAAAVSLPNDPESLLVRSMWEHREQLSELTVDYLDALFAVWIEQTKEPSESAVVCLDDLLKLRGLQMNPHGNGRRSGFTQKQRDQVLAEIERIECIYLDVIEYKRRGHKRENVVQSRAMVVTEREGQRRLDGGVDVEHIVYQPGKIFGQYLQTKGRQTALLSAKALEYHPQKEDVEKRLTRYLSWQWRIRSRSISYGQPYKVRTLLDIARIAVHKRNTYRAIERLHKALDRLQADSVIAAWQFEEGWRDDWDTERKLDGLIEIEPTDVIRVNYLSIFKKPLRQLHSPTRTTEIAPQNEIPKHEPPKRTRKSRSMNNESFGARLRHKRAALGLNQMQVADLFNTSQATIARAESDAKISAEMYIAMQKWLTE